eukprot:Em0019g1048a
MGRVILFSVIVLLFVHLLGGDEGNKKQANSGHQSVEDKDTKQFDSNDKTLSSIQDTEDIDNKDFRQEVDSHKKSNNDPSEIVSEENLGTVNVERESVEEQKTPIQNVALNPNTVDNRKEHVTTESDPAEDLYLEGSAHIWKWDKSVKKRGYALLSEAAAKGNKKAQADLAYGYLFGNILERNFTKAFEVFSDLASQGDPGGQQGLGYMYSVGLGVNSSLSKAVLYYTFAALGGHPYAQMAMGYRATNGIGVAENCETALSYYYRAAKKVADELVVLTGGQLVSKIRLIEEDTEATNVYGVSEEDMVHYRDVFVDTGNAGAQLILGMFYLYGYGGMDRNLEYAIEYLEQAAEGGVGAANALLGRIYAEGSKEVPKNFKKAISYFQAAIQQKSPEGYTGMGIMLLHGTGVEQDYRKAMNHFQIAAEHGSAEGQYYMGLMYYKGYGVNKDFKKALHYFQLASQGGYILAVYYLAEMHAEGKGVKRSCTLAVEFFKSVAERGKWTQLLSEAQKLYAAEDATSALVIYLLLSEMGIEVAQSNAAYILEQEKLDIVSENETLKRALVLWSKAAAQGYSMARVKLGDYYYYGFGTDVNHEAAVSQYRIASDKLNNAQAMFNLGYMFEHGLGINKEYHLAKRYYDMATEASTEALVPANLALFKLNIVHYFSTFKELLLHSFENDTLVDNLDLLLIVGLTLLLILVIMWRRRRQ